MAVLTGIAGLFLMGCSNHTEDTNAAQNIKDKSWEEILQEADGETVRLYMWGGDEGINQYIDEYVKPELQAEHNVTLDRIPLDTNEIIQKLETEKRAGQDDGTIDLIWMNGENFKRAKENDLLFGPFTDQIPSYQAFYDTESLDFQYDFGTETDGLEAPWGKVQFVFHYDASKIQEPPATLDELMKFAEENPGRFTYPAAGDFTGDAFIRHVLYGKASSIEQLLDSPFSEEVAETESEEVWAYLNDMTPHLWRSGATYPSSLTELDRLYSQGEVWMTMGYNEARAEDLVEKGIFPETTESFVLQQPGSIGNTHFLSIPDNSRAKEGAMAAIDFLLSPEAQLAKLEPAYWGENTPIDLALLDDEDKAAFEELDRGETVIDQQTLTDAFLPEIDAEYVPWLQEKWIDEVASQ
ncbi:ABC transporter substrate-binding protein [Jeotgalibacillus proteolyticus]|uniref:ABC transporter substrate-binding protein n=2 Tax=Jeotgalibacillus proteolyticus TaxID=2082395 RepID=A0A2S5GDR2_9BACL|nr:ABC transporter substrate-binding protein [Jeotgalibacillus proteolyticus]